MSSGINIKFISHVFLLEKIKKMTDLLYWRILHKYGNEVANGTKRVGTRAPWIFLGFLLLPSRGGLNKVAVDRFLP